VAGPRFCIHRHGWFLFYSVRTVRTY
jgi:hypothetical protein